MLVPLPTPVPIRHGVVDRDGWLAVAQDVLAGGGRLVSLWGSRRPRETVACAAYAFSFEGGLAWIELPLAEREGYPDLARLFPAAARMQRAAHDLDGLVAEGADDTRPWLDHGLWQGRSTPAPYEFVRVEGEGVHEIAVGPVHAGIIEPGHFRFSVVGEKVLRLEERLGYVHKGIDRRFCELPPLEAHRLAGRVSGDSTVAYAWAYCMALEAAAACSIPERAQWLRAVLLERER
ncbi:MAG TPA: NADH-quinone oxidoreductase subunit C, partial [Ideonella sp.]|nr:NADH-quinone oxidoreductase subunit C [Ideonella sp.]